MKRSSQVSLVLLASAATITLAGCEDQPNLPPDNGGTFANKAECVAVYDQRTCDAAERLARAEHAQNAPRFNRREQCVAEYGEEMCQPASAYTGNNNDGGIFVPMMIGYMMGSATSSPVPMYYGPGSYRNRNRANYYAPIYASGANYRSSGPIGQAQYTSQQRTTQGTLRSSTSMTPPGSQRGGFGSSFRPTSQFRTSYQARNPQSFGATSYSRSTGTVTSRATVSSRGGFGGSARGFSGG